MSDQTYGVLLLSFSKYSHQASFVPLYQSHPRVRLVAIADEPDIEPELKALNQSWADKLDIPYIEGVDRALESKDVHIVSIGHEIERRAQLAVRAAAAGKHLWIDKFIGANMDECDAVVAAVEEAGVYSIIPSYVYGELAAQARTLIDSGRLGALLGVHADVMFGKGWPQPIPEGERDFLPPGRWKFADIKRELLCVGAYGVGLVQACLGGIAHVYGRAGAYFFNEHASLGADDFGTLNLTDECGRVATVCGGRVGMAAHPHGGPARAYLIGSKASAAVDGKGPVLNTYIREDIAGADYRLPPEDPMQWHHTAPAQAASLAPDSTGLWMGLEDLVAALDEHRQPAYTVREARDHMEIIIAGYTSVVCGETVRLPLRRQAD